MIIAGYDQVSDYMYNPQVNIIHATHSSNRGRMISSKLYKTVLLVNNSIIKRTATSAVD